MPLRWCEEDEREREREQDIPTFLSSHGLHDSPSPLELENSIELDD